MSAPATRRILTPILALALTMGLVACDQRAPSSTQPAPAPTPAPSSTPSAAATTARLVVLSPGLAILLRDLGYADRIVARHAFDPATPRDVPAAGDEAGINEEALLKARPDAVLLQRSARGVPPRLAELAARRTFELHDIPMLGLDDIPAAARDLDLLVQRLERRDTSSAPTDSPATAPTPLSPRATALLADMSRAWAPRPNAHARVGRVLLLASADPPAAFGPGSWHHDLLLRLGATPAITSGAPFVELNAEAILRLAPDAIILITTAPPSAAPDQPTTSDLTRQRLGRVADLAASTPAFATGRLASIDDPLAHTPSSAMVHLADRIDAILAHWSPPPAQPPAPPSAHP